ncbi:FecR family protein [Arcticibacter tournemirensis]|uniref:FecR family protein n=1 Tax=Arcticibacter tournemirensis TaxID=699437 RepID=UPI0011544A2D|nr:FecR domain-containing protein [Arcticibacter tournemirensis]TQM51629.1 FecR family protein [Arcticibacter tournemirensis]
MKKETPKALIDKYLSGKATAEEKAIVESWYLEHASHQADDLPEPNYSSLDQEMWAVIYANTPARRKTTRLWPFLRSAAAAAVLIMLGVWVYYKPHQTNFNRGTQFATQHDVLPGKNTATLTLSNGKTINLSDAKTGVVIDTSKLRYNDGEELAISSESAKPLNQNPETASFPTSGQDWGSMTGGWTIGHLPGSGISGTLTAMDERKAMQVSTPRGGTYQIVLPDGTKVWLNAASTIKFPSDFHGVKQRIIELTGEAYFAVHKSRNIPFVVRSQGQEIQVLGTEFNVNSYFDEEQVTTTLVYGSVKVNALNGKSVLLIPGEESLLGPLNLKKRDADIAMATSWRHGTFYFNKTPFTAMMRQVSRWYNVEVVYLTKEIPDIRFTGEIKRDVTLKTVLTYLEDLGVNLRLMDRTLIIE